MAIESLAVTIGLFSIAVLVIAVAGTKIGNLHPQRNGAIRRSVVGWSR